MSQIAIFILLAAHCIGDYPMQGEFLATYKSKDNLVLLVHCIIYTAFMTVGFVLSMILLDISITTSIINLIIFIMIVSHFLIDKWKCVYRDKLYARTDISDVERQKLDVRSYYTDQALHILILVILYVLI